MNEPYTDSIEYTHFLRFREGDQQSLAWLHQQFHPALLRRGLQILPNKFAVSTAIQKAFLDVCTFRQRIQSPGHLYCFLRLLMRWYCNAWYCSLESKIIRYNDHQYNPEALKDDTAVAPFKQRPANNRKEEMPEIIYTMN